MCFRRMGFPPILSLLVPALALEAAPWVLTGPTSMQTRRSPTTCFHVRDCGATLESPSFSARDGSTGKLLRTFEMVAASKPTSRLSPRSHFLYHLASSSGPWSAVWVLSLLSTKLLPRALTPGVRHTGIRSWVSAGRREAPRPNSVALPPVANSRGWP